MNTTAADTNTPDALRDAMVKHVKQAGHARSAAVEDALRTVERHRYVPDAIVTDAYADFAVITKCDDSGNALSCASVPTVVAMMLDQLDIRPGQRILEIGAGTGYNAALLAHLTGPTGHVTTVDIDPDVTAQARRALEDTGYHDVSVYTRDGALGAPEHAPYDRIIVTVGAWDIPPAWIEQLRPNGRLVVPLRWRGQTRSVGFTRHGDRLHADSLELCGFVPMIGQEGERSGQLEPDQLVALYWDTDQPLDIDTLAGVLDQPKTTTWTEVTIHAGESFDGIWLRLTATEPGTCRIAAEPAAVESGLCTPAIAIRTPAIAEADSLAYLAVQRTEDTQERLWVLGAIGHGPAGQQLAERLCDQIRSWNDNRTRQPVIDANPINADIQAVPRGQVIDKRHARLVLSM